MRRKNDSKQIQFGKNTTRSNFVNSECLVNTQNAINANDSLDSFFPCTQIQREPNNCRFRRLMKVSVNRSIRLSKHDWIETGDAFAFPVFFSVFFGSHIRSDNHADVHRAHTGTGTLSSRVVLRYRRLWCQTAFGFVCVLMVSVVYMLSAHLFLCS